MVSEKKSPRAVRASNTEDEINVSCPFPKCGKVHTYQLKIVRVPVFGLMTPEARPHRRKVEVQVVFTCPSTNQAFKAPVELYVDEYSRIESVSAVTTL